MICPKCGGNTQVYDSRPLTDDVTIRRRRCRSGHKFATFESRLDPRHKIRHREKERIRAQKRRDEMTIEQKVMASQKAQARQEAAKTGRKISEIQKEWGIQ